MTDSELIEKALEIATRAHKGQLDLDGKPVSCTLWRLG